MVMAGLGIDCSGFVTRVVDTLLKEKGVGSIRSHLRPRSLVSWLKFIFRSYTNLSANDLVDKVNCVEIKNLDDVVPSDLIKLGKGHVAIVTKVEKRGGRVFKIEYCHSTSDYLDEHGVRKGSITIIHSKKGLEKQKWDEYYHGRNWNLEDYIKAKPKDRGFRRLRVFVSPPKR
jgi:hypothetical protein